MRILVLIGFVFWSSLASAGAIVSRGDNGRLFSVLDRAERGDAITVVGIGGSITNNAIVSDSAKGWLTRSAQWFVDTYGKGGATVKVINSGYGSTDSIYGVLRFHRDVVAHRPDVIFIDFAVNDAPDRLPYYEEVMRLALQVPGAAVVAVMFCNSLRQGQQEAQAELAARYGVPVVSYRDGVDDLVAKGETTWSTVSHPDGVHPGEAGHAFEARFLVEFFEQVRSDHRAARSLMKPIYEGPLRKVNYLSGAELDAAVARRSQLADANFNYIKAAFANVSGVVGAFIELDVDIGAPGEIWLTALDAADWGTIAVLVDGALVAVHDCNKPALKTGVLVPFRVAAGVAPGRHNVRIENWPSPSNAAMAGIWLDGIGFSRP